MRRTLFVGNWKANKTIAETEEYFKELPSVAASFTSEVVLCPPFTSLEYAMRYLPSTIALGAQDVSYLGAGAYTGEITASMLSALKVKYTIVGHAERRALGEDNSKINKKILNLMAVGISPVLCIGDTLDEYNSNMTREVLEKQIRECLNGVKEFGKIVIAYMPIWAMGTGYIAAGDYVNIIADFIRKTVQKMTGNPMSANFPILYGGTLTAANAKEFLEVPEIDGIMFGGSSLKVQSLNEIVNTKFKIKKYSED